MTTKPLEDREFQFVFIYLLFSVTHLSKQNASILQVFLYIMFSKKYFLNANHTWKTLLVKVEKLQKLK